MSIVNIRVFKIFDLNSKYKTECLTAEINNEFVNIYIIYKTPFLLVKPF